MDKFLETKLSNVLRCEGDYILNSDIPMREKASKMDDIFNLQKILMYYNELEPMLKEFFAKKAEEERWKNNNANKEH